MDTDTKVIEAIEQAIVALMDLGASHKTALYLLATQAILRVGDLDQLRKIRTEVNSRIICADDSIADDTAVTIGPCDCIVVDNPLLRQGGRP